MAFGCVYQVVVAPPGAEWQLDEIVVLACETPCQEKTITTGPNTGCILSPLSEECMEYPPE